MVYWPTAGSTALLRARAGGAGATFAAICLVGVLSSSAAGQVEHPPVEPETPPRAQGFEPIVEAPVEDGPSYEITSFRFYYPVEHPNRPSIEEILQRSVTLGEVDGVYVAPRPGIALIRIRLAELTEQHPGRRFSVSALNAIGREIVQELNARGIIGVLVAPDREQIDPETLEDLREEGDTGIVFEVWTRSIQEIRTLGAGRRWTTPRGAGGGPGVETRINNPVHERIRLRSPLQPGDLLRKDILDEYLFRLDRQPGRRVDAAVSATDEPGSVYLDYIVTENRPWTLYFQLSNTGTEQTEEWRERFGFVHNQLTGRDDVLSIDFITAGFKDTNALLASYEVPLSAARDIRLRAFGSYSNFKASDVGFADERFEGDSWGAGAELILNVLQSGQNFVDLFGGARWQNIRVENKVVDLEGETSFLIPYLGARYERATERSRSGAEIRIETNLPDVAGTDDEEIERLGRLFVDDDWTVFKWSLDHSFYLEPLLFRAAAHDPDAPQWKTALAHEIALSFRGQHAFDNRLIPQEEETLGGLYTVRGYPESIAAGDNAVVFSAEYRFHLPRVLAIQEDPSQTPLFGEPFRFSPDQRYGRPDWDLVFRAFLDAGRVTNSDRQSFEEDHTLMGAGLGVEFLFKRNLNLRVDWGMALRDVRDTDAGDSRIHFVGTLLY